MFSTVLDKLDTWVGRSFLLASFFPFLIFLGANALMAQVVVPEAMKFVVSTFVDFGTISSLAVWLAAAAAIAYVTDPLVGKTMNILEGTYIPARVSGWLSTDQTRRLRNLENEEQELGKLLDELDDYRKTLDQEMGRAQAEGLATHKHGDPKLVSVAEAALDVLNRRMNSQQLTSVGALKKAGTKLQAALRANCIDSNELEPADIANGKTQRALCKRLDEMVELWVRLVAYTGAKLDDQRAHLIYDKQFSFGSIPTKGAENWILLQAPTRFGNKVEAQSSFAETRFKFDFKFFWPIFQLVVAEGDQKTTDALTNAQQKLDFCVRILLYTIAFTAIWVVVVAVYRRDNAWLILALGTGGLLLTMLWMETIHANYRSLAELIRNVIVLKRFDVLKALHQSLPADWEHEQKQWQALTNQLLWGSAAAADITYQHGDK